MNFFRVSERKIMYAGKTGKKKIILVYYIKRFRNNAYVPIVKKKMELSWHVRNKGHHIYVLVM